MQSGDWGFNRSSLPKLSQQLSDLTEVIQLAPQGTKLVVHTCGTGRKK